MRHDRPHGSNGAVREMAFLEVSDVEMREMV